MTAEEAYKIATKNTPFIRVRGCLDYGSFFAFTLAPLYIDESEDYISGTTMTAVDKKTKRVFEYDITSDVSAYERAREIKVKTFFDKKIT